MAGPEVLIDYESVLKVAAQFNTSAESFNAMLQPLEAAAESLKTRSFVGQTGDKAALNIEAIQQRIRQINARCLEMVQDLNAATIDYRSGDEQGAQRFTN
ncbi:MAG: WXG100 family type VII secretion target [Anaerolineae bacterium]